VAKSYEGRRILVSADCTLATGRITALFGRMGSGKSTLLRICAGLVAPEEGTVRVVGAAPATRGHLGYAALARLGLYYMAADGSGAPHLTLRQHLRDLQRQYDTSNMDAIKPLGVDQLMDVRFKTLSGGERKRVELAVAIARQPRILLADEPFRDVDPILTDVIAHALRTLAERSCAIVVTGHEASTILRYADEVVWLTAGRTHVLGTPQAAVQHARFRQEYLHPDVAR
jgi:ABC-type multidrug transport system ATPase subunit